MKNIDMRDMQMADEKLVRYTPRQLINHHIMFPEQPITYLLLENMILGSLAAVFDQHHNHATPVHN